MKTRRHAVAVIALPGLDAVRRVFASGTCEVERVAALVEIAATASALARHLVKLRRLDPDLIGPHVARRSDLRAVLGRGRWLPTMTQPPVIADPSTHRRPVDPCPAHPTPAAGTQRDRRRGPRPGNGPQDGLFPPAGGVGGGG